MKHKCDIPDISHYNLKCDRVSINKKITLIHRQDGKAELQIDGTTLNEDQFTIEWHDDFTATITILQT